MSRPIPSSPGRFWDVDIFSDHQRYPVRHRADAPLPGHSVNLTVSGQCRFGHESGPNFIATAGDIVFIEPQKVHLWEVLAGSAGRDKRAPWHVLFCGYIPRPTWAPWLRYPHTIPGYARLHIDDSAVFRELRRAFLQMYRFACGSLPNRSEFQMNLLEHVILWCQAYRAEQLRGLDPRIQRTVEFLSSSLNQPITLEDAARHAHLSRARLAALFRRQLGDSPMRFLEMCRLLRARQLLRLTDETMDSIAASVGFCDAKYFANRFRQRVGMAPSQFRAAARSGKG